MSNIAEFDIENIVELKQKILQWSSKYSSVAILDSNNYKNDSYKKQEYLAGVCAEKEIKFQSSSNSFNRLKEFIDSNNKYVFGYFTYDLKNDIENLKSENSDNLLFPEMHFFVPKYVFKIRNNILTIISDENNFDEIYNDILSQKLIVTNDNENRFTPMFSKNEYVNTVNKLKQHIQFGNIYEINFCQEFYSEKSKINPIEVYSNLNKISPTPFSTFYKVDTNYLLSATPERFVTKQANKVFSQPIKGTIKRDIDSEKDKKLINQLKNDKKEISENVMIVDLVRNDLSRIAKRGSVKVDDLFGIYTFPQVHQMISTISAEVEDGIDNVEIIRNMFPMGSMTGAPKIRAMKLIEEYERTKRGLFSGSVGYFAPNGDFDFNVIIRSLLYNSDNNYLSFQVGSAITINSDAEKEYDECLVKAKAMLLASNATISS